MRRITSSPGSYERIGRIGHSSWRAVLIVGSSFTQAFASGSARQAPEALASGWQNGFVGLQSLGVFAMLAGTLLWLLPRLQHADGGRRSSLGIGGLVLVFFGAASVWVGTMPLVSATASLVTSSSSSLAAIAVMLLALPMLFHALQTGNRRGTISGAGGDIFVTLWLALLVALVVVPLAGAWSLVWSQGGSLLTNIAVGSERLLAPRYFSLRCLYDSASGAGSCGSAINSIALGAAVALLACGLGLAMALVAQRVSPTARRLLALVVCLPMLTPPFLIGLGLSQIFGQAGFFSLLLESSLGIARNRWFFGGYGLTMAQVLAFFPVAYFLALGALDSIGRVQLDVARQLGASRSEVLRSIVLPAIRDSLAVALLVIFVESLSDIGNPLVVGGKLRVLATELFYAGNTDLVAGDLTGAPIVLMVAVALFMAFIKNRLAGRSVRRQQLASDGGGAAGAHPGDAERGIPPLPAGLHVITGALLALSIVLLLTVYTTIGVGAFSQGGQVFGALTPDNFSRGFGFSFAGSDLRLTGSGWPSLVASLVCAALVAPFSAILGMSMVWILRRGGLRAAAGIERFSTYVLSVPSVVIGAGFLLAFGHLGLSTRATWLLILLAMSIRNLAVCMRFGGVALGRLDASLTEISGLCGAGALTTFSRIVAPLLQPTFLVCVAYGFVRSITMLGSVLFLASVENQVATTYMIDRIGIGEYGVSMAYGVVLAAIVGGVFAIALALRHLLGRRLKAAHGVFGELQAAVISGHGRPSGVA